MMEKEIFKNELKSHFEKTRDRKCRYEIIRGEECFTVQVSDDGNERALFKLSFLYEDYKNRQNIENICTSICQAILISKPVQNVLLNILQKRELDKIDIYPYLEQTKKLECISQNNHVNLITKKVQGTDLSIAWRIVAKENDTYFVKLGERFMEYLGVSMSDLDSTLERVKDNIFIENKAMNDYYTRHVIAIRSAKGDAAVALAVKEVQEHLLAQYGPVYIAPLCKSVLLMVKRGEIDPEKFQMDMFEIREISSEIPLSDCIYLLDEEGLHIAAE